MPSRTACTQGAIARDAVHGDVALVARHQPGSRTAFGCRIGTISLIDRMAVNAEVCRILNSAGFANQGGHGIWCHKTIENQYAVTVDRGLASRFKTSPGPLLGS